MNGGRSSLKTQLNKKTFIQSKLCFPETTQSTINKEKGKYVSHLVVSEKRKDSNSDITHEIVDVSKQKKLRLNDMLLDKKFEKLDEKYVYCHYCDMGKSITLH